MTGIINPTWDMKITLWDVSNDTDLRTIPIESMTWYELAQFLELDDDNISDEDKKLAEKRLNKIAPLKPEEIESKTWFIKSFVDDIINSYTPWKQQASWDLDIFNINKNLNIHWEFISDKKVDNQSTGPDIMNLNSYR